MIPGAPAVTRLRLPSLPPANVEFTISDALSAYFNQKFRFY